MQCNGSIAVNYVSFLTDYRSFRLLSESEASGQSFPSLPTVDDRSFEIWAVLLHPQKASIPNTRHSHALQDPYIRRRRRSCTCLVSALILRAEFGSVNGTP